MYMKRNLTFMMAMAAMAFISYLAMSVMFIGISYLYSHIAEKVDGVTVDQGIEDFESLTDNK